MGYIRTMRGFEYPYSILLFVGIFMGCATKPLYYWGDYEPVIYDHYMRGSTPDDEIERLRRGEKEAQVAKLPLAPGYHSYLGYLYYQVGNHSMARDEFIKEKTEFADSSVLMNRFLKEPNNKEPNSKVTDNKVLNKKNQNEKSAK